MSHAARKTFRLLTLLVVPILAGVAHAGGGPENVLLVVNSRSWASISVANHYIRLREIPAENVLFLDWSEQLPSTDVETFRQKILRPILATIENNELEDHIDYIVYSSDFPWSVDAHGDVQHLKLPSYLIPNGSLTGMTYLWPLVWARRPDWLALNSNHYFRPEHPEPGVPATHAFRSWYGWANNGALLEAGGQHYILSATLAVTSGRGNSLAEVVDYLTRSAQADGTMPKGTIYFDQNQDIRAQCRAPKFPAAVEQLARLGVNAEIVRDALPRARPDVQGVMAGLPDFSWSQSLSTIRPGAICENLTSAGAWFRPGDMQTPLTEWLRYGAAGSSGTVVEPYLIDAKFPAPSMHVHYARGSSLAEAYYQAVASPYQLLIVGDALCQPWARRPQIAIAGLTAGETVSGKRMLEAKVSPASADRVQWLLDGHRMAVATPGDRIQVECDTLPDGYHELRAVAIDSGNLETQGRAIVPFSIAAHGHRCQLAASTSSPSWDKPLRLTCTAPGASQIVVCQQTRVMAKVAGEQTSLEVAPQVLGLGPVRLEAFASFPDSSQPVRSQPLELNVSCGPFSPAVELAREQVVVPGFEVVIGDAEPQIVQEMQGERWITRYGGAPGMPFAISGVVDVKSDDVYQLQVRFFGSLKCEVDGRQVFTGTGGNYNVNYIPVPLAAGLHRVRLLGTLGDPPTFELQFGSGDMQFLNPKLLKRIAGP